MSIPRLLAGLLLAVVTAAYGAARPRIVISSDFPPLDVIPGTLPGPAERRSDPDDVQSMVRFLLYANEFRVEALIASSGTLANHARKQNLLDILAIYEKVEANLRRHDPAYPTARYLRERTKEGLGGTYDKPAAEILGEGKDSEASRYIIELVDRPGSEPIWFCFWGGSQELGQALWRVRKERSPEAVQRFASKLRVYLIADQDGSARWMMENFPEMFVVFSRSAFRGMFFNAPGGSPASGDIEWLNQNVRKGHGPLGAVYPRSGWNHRSEGVIEGDTPSFLYVYSGSTGLSDLDQPHYGGWGGRFQQSGDSPRQWVDAAEGGKAVSRWADARQRDFAARMDRCVLPPGKVNRAPVAVVKGTQQRVKPGARVELDASGSSDPDSQQLSYRWWVYREPSSFTAAIEAAESSKAVLHVPPDADGEIHVLLEVTDSGRPALTSYRRVVMRTSATP
jgi:hypothetical protein